MHKADLTIVQLSDLHVRADESCPPLSRIDELTSSIRIRIRSKHLIIAFTGDISYSGQTKEYDIAKSFLSAIATALSPDVEMLQMAFVPGNHDVDLSQSTLRTQALDSILKSPPPSLQQIQELSTTGQHFFSFCSSFAENCLQWHTLNAATTTIELEKVSVQLTGINSASCSKVPELQNSLFVDIGTLPKRSDLASCQIVLIHHPLHWIHESIRGQVADWISETSELVLTGHEHEGDQMEIARRNLPTTQYIAGQALHDPRASSEGLQVVNIDLSNRNCLFEVISFSHDTYQLTASYEKRLADSGDRDKRLRVRTTFLTEMEALNVGVKHSSGKKVTHSSIFVYPDLRFQPGKKVATKVESGEFLDGASLADRAILERKLLIVGEEDSGKTFLLRQLFKDFQSKGLFPVLVSARELRADHLESSIKKTLKNIYELTDSESYFGVPKPDRMLLVDDIDLLKDAHKGIDAIAKYAEQWFGGLVLSCKELMLLRDPLTGEGSQELWQMPTATIGSSSFSKRSALIERWVGHDPQLQEADAYQRSLNLENRVNELLMQKAIPAFPMALTLILESMDSRDSVDESTGAFGYHYQRLILQALSHEQQRRSVEHLATVTDDIALELLGRVAFKVYSKKDKTLDLTEVRKIASDMRDELIIEFSTDAAVDTLTMSGLLKIKNDDVVDFQYKYVYQFSIAKLLSLWLNNDSHSTEVRKVVDCLVSKMHLAENASIVIFFTFLTRDSATIRSIVEQASNTFAGIEVCDFGQVLDSYFLETEAPSMPSPNVRLNRNELNRLRDKKDILKVKQTAAISKIRKDSKASMQEIDKAFQCMQVLGQILRAYPTRLSGPEKKLVAAECYKLGLRTLSKLRLSIEEAQVLVKEYFRKITEGHVDVHDIQEFEQELDRQLAQYIQIGSLAIVKRIARAVGSVHLRPLYPQIQIEATDRPVKIINRAIGLELLNEVRIGETIQLYERLMKEKCRTAASVLRMLVWEYCFLHPVAGSTRRSLLTRLGMQEHPSMLSKKLKTKKGVVRHKPK